MTVIKCSFKIIGMINRIIGIVLFVIAIGVGIQTIVEPLYHASSEAQMSSPFWNILNPLMVLAVVLGVIYSYIRKSAADSEEGGAITREYFAANTLFYGFVFVGILLLWNWFNELKPAYTAVSEDTSAIVWILIDATLPLLSGTLGLSLLRGGSK